MLPFFILSIEPSSLQSGSFVKIAHRAISSLPDRFEPQLDHKAAEMLPFFILSIEPSSLQSGSFVKIAHRAISSLPDRFEPLPDHKAAEMLPSYIRAGLPVPIIE